MTRNPDATSSSDWPSLASSYNHARVRNLLRQDSRFGVWGLGFRIETLKLEPRGLDFLVCSPDVQSIASVIDPPLEKEPAGSELATRDEI